MYDMIPPGAYRDKKSKAIVFGKKPYNDLKEKVSNLEQTIQLLIEKIDKLEQKKSRRKKK